MCPVFLLTPYRCSILEVPLFKIRKEPIFYAMEKVSVGKSSHFEYNRMVMEEFMNKADKIFIGIVIICALLLYVPLWWINYQNQGKQKEVVVSYKDQEVLRESLAKDHTYQVKGTLGEVNIEVSDHKVRVEKETSPLHLCSIQGWVEDANRPIVCLPNNIVVQIVTTEQDQDDVDTVVQ